MLEHAEVCLVGTQGPGRAVGAAARRDGPVIVDLVRLPDAEARRAEPGYVGLAWCIVDQRRRAGRRALILVENLSVPFDRRVWQECTTLRDAGWEVHVICPQGTKRDTEPEAEIDGVRIHRYPLRAATGGPAGYLRSTASALWHTVRLARKVGPVDVVHACNPPDLLFLVGLRLKRRGARFVFDQHDLVPELYLSRFGRGRGPALPRRVRAGAADLPGRGRRHRHQRELPATSR